jgi:aryl-alcohol dehydrogenase-like predicted oxidoreductase
VLIGISDTPAWIASQAQTIAELRGWSRFVAHQGEYNLLQRGIEREVAPMTRALGMSVLAFSAAICKTTWVYWALP